MRPAKTRLRPATAVLLLVAAGLSGCNAISALNRAGEPLDAYELRGNLPAPKSGRVRDLQVVIETPVVGKALDTDRILIRPDGLQTQYMPDGRWADMPAKMLQTALVREIEATGAFRYVGRQPLGPGGDFAVVSEITDFQAELSGAVPITRVRVTARIVREMNVGLVASRVFEVTVPAASTRTRDLVTALDAGLSQISGQMTEWVIGSV